MIRIVFVSTAFLALFFCTLNCFSKIDRSLVYLQTDQGKLVKNHSRQLRYFNQKFYYTQIRACTNSSDCIPSCSAEDCFNQVLISDCFAPVEFVCACSNYQCTAR